MKRPVDQACVIKVVKIRKFAEVIKYATHVGAENGCTYNVFLFNSTLIFKTQKNLYNIHRKVRGKTGKRIVNTELNFVLEGKVRT